MSTRIGNGTVVGVVLLHDRVCMSEHLDPGLLRLHLQRLGVRVDDVTPFVVREVGSDVSRIRLLKRA